jgi:hypothetical protein
MAKLYHTALAEVGARGTLHGPGNLEGHDDEAVGALRRRFGPPKLEQAQPQGD